MFSEQISVPEIMKSITVASVKEWIDSVFIFIPELIVLYFLSTLDGNPLHKMGCVVAFISLWYYHP